MIEFDPEAIEAETSDYCMFNNTPKVCPCRVSGPDPCADCLYAVPADGTLPRYYDLID